MARVAGSSFRVMNEFSRIGLLMLVLLIASVERATAMIVHTEAYNGHTYHLLDTDGTQWWLEAEAEAIQLGGYLVTINDAAEDQWVFDTFAPLATAYAAANGLPDQQAISLWIGLSDYLDEGTYTWASGEPVQYANWAPGEPAGSFSDEDFAAIFVNFRTPGKWHDIVGDTRLADLPFAVVEVESPTCDPTSVLLPDNSRAFDAYEAVITNDSLDTDEARMGAVDIHARVLNLPFIRDRGLLIWASIDDISVSSSMVSVTPNQADALGAKLAELRLVPPGAHASFAARFCGPGDASFTLGFNRTAIALTIADMLVSVVPVVGQVTPDRVLAFADALNDVPLVASATDHISEAWGDIENGNASAALRKVGAAARDLLRLASNPSQRDQLRQAFVNLGINVTLGSLFRALVHFPLRALQTFADVIALAIHKGFGSDPIVVTVMAAP